jgi:hypothetical protein
LEIGLLGYFRWEKGMADAISKTFVVVFLLDYLLMFGILISWAIRTWLPKAGKTSDSQRSHGIQPH